MADNVFITAARNGVPAATDELTTLNGVTQPVDENGNFDPNGKKPQAQRIKLVHGTDGVATDVSVQSGLPIADFSGPVVWLNDGVATVTKAGVLAVPARAQRTRLVMQHAGDQSGAWTLAQRVWLGWGAAPVAGGLPKGSFLDPGAVFDQYVQGTLAMWLMLDPSAADGSSQTVTFTELAG